METSFKPRYTPFLYPLFILYAAPWLYSIPNAIWGSTTADWKLFWLFSGAIWALAGLLHMKSALIKRVVFGEEISVFLVLQKKFVLNTAESIRIFDETIDFAGRIVLVRYLSNAPELLHLLSGRAEKEAWKVSFEEHGYKDAGWSMERSLLFMIGFALYMMLMISLRIHPIRLIGIATDSLLLWWALLMPVLLGVKAIKGIRERMTRRQEAPRWI